MKNDFQQLLIIFGAFVMGQILICLVILVLDPLESAGSAREGSSLYDSLVPIFLLSMIFAVYLINQKREGDGAMLNTLTEKVAHYRQTVILRLAMMEGANLFTLIIILIDGRTYYMIYFVIGLAVFIYFRPAIQNFIASYQLNSAEQKELNEALG